MPPTGYVHATTPLAILHGPAVLYVGGVPHSASRDVRAELVAEIRQPAIDGVPSSVAGLDRVVGYTARVTGTFLELGTPQIQRLLHGVTGVLATGVTTFTPRDAGAYLPGGGYVSDVKVRIKDGGGKFHNITLASAFRSEYGVEGADRAEVTVPTTFEARSADGQAPPWTYVIEDAVLPPPVGGLNDTFTRADSAVAPGVADSGHTYTTLGVDSWGIQTNQLYRVAAGGGGYTKLVANGLTSGDGTLSVKMFVSGAGSGLSFRATDDANLFITEYAGGSLVLYRRQTGAYTSIGSAVLTFISGETLAAVLNGSSIIIRRNGVDVITVTDAFNATATLHGVSADAVTTRFDDLVFA